MNYFRCGGGRSTHTATKIDVAKTPLASFESNVSGLYIPEILAYIQATQSGSGDPYPDGGSKNELPMSISDMKVLNTTGTWKGNAYTLNGVTFSVLTDTANNIKGIQVNGTATAEANFDISEYTLKAGTSKKINGTSTNSSNTTIAYGFKGYGIVSANADRRVTRAEGVGDWNNYVYIKVYQGYNAQNLMYYPMIRDASISDGTFAPYSNIRPITGHTELNLVHTGKNQVNILPFAEWSVIRSYACYASHFLHRRLKMLFFDRDTSVSISGINFGFYDTNWTGTPNINSAQYRWVVSNGTILSENRNIPTNGDTSIFLDGLIIYPNTEENYNSIFSRYNIMVVFESDTATTYEAYTGQTATINLGGTYYGGYLNVTTGLLTVTDGIVDLGTLSWGYDNTGGKAIFYSPSIRGLIKPPASMGIVPNVIAEIFKTVNAYTTGTPNPNDNQISVNTDGSIWVNDLSYTTSSSFKSAMSGVKFVYELATPQTYQLTPAQIEQLLGQNNVFCSTGDVAVKYWKID